MKSYTDIIVPILGQLLQKRQKYEVLVQDTTLPDGCNGADSGRILQRNCVSHTSLFRLSVYVYRRKDRI